MKGKSKQIFKIICSFLFSGNKVVFILSGVAMLIIYIFFGTAPIKNNSPLSAKSRMTCSRIRVVDGDTVVANCPNGRHLIRLQYIDAPEIRQKTYGLQARNALSKLLLNQFEFQFNGFDKYRRSLGVLYSGGLDLNQELIAQGMAIAYRFKGVKIPSSYLLAEKNAKRKKLGIWQKSGLQQNPAKWRRMCQSGHNISSSCI